MTGTGTATGTVGGAGAMGMAMTRGMGCGNMPVCGWTPAEAPLTNIANAASKTADKKVICKIKHIKYYYNGPISNKCPIRTHRIRMLRHVGLDWIEDGDRLMPSLQLCQAYIAATNVNQQICLFDLI